MSGFLPPPVDLPWLRVGTALRRVTIVTQIEYWHGHYIFDLNGKVRCEEGGCWFCDRGFKRLLLFVVGVDDPIGGRCLWELRERHRSLLEECAKGPNSSVGAKVDTWRDSTAKNAPVRVKFREFVAADEWYIHNLVANLGISPSKVRDFIDSGRRDDETTQGGEKSGVYVEREGDF